jgi:3-hydroxy-9,10-secoandrosta-1,3,5(10)-triene-9,17-dione monooxygenase
MPFGQLFGLTVSLPFVGALETAIEYCKTTGGRKLPSGVTDPMMQHSLANAAAAASFSRLVASTNLKILNRTAGDGQIPSTAERIKMRFETATIANRCVSAINDLFVAHGTRSVLRNNRVAQIWLDMNAANLHAGNNIGRFRSNYAESLYGKSVNELLI